MKRPAVPPATLPFPAIGPYRLVRLIGRGAMGAVYLALDERQGQPVALKLLSQLADANAATDADENARTRLLAEAAAVGRLAHPDIVAVLDAGIGPHGAWLAMALAPGVPLQRYTQAARLLPIALVVQLGARIAGALAHAHALGVVHRDIKPGNVIVDLPGGSLKVVDFGLARLADAEATRTGLVLGSPEYLAPEQLAGAAPAAAGDLYALGVTLFELLCGRRPHEAASMGELLRQVAQAPAPRVSAVQPAVPPALDSLVAALLDKQAARRPASAAAVAAALQAMAPSAPPTPAGPKSRP